MSIGDVVEAPCHPPTNVGDLEEMVKIFFNIMSDFAIVEKHGMIAFDEVERKPNFVA